MNTMTRSKLGAMDRIADEFVGVASDDLTQLEINVVAILVELGMLRFDENREIVRN